MKKIIYILLLGVLGFFTHSCDLDTSPTNAIEESLVFTNAENAEKVLNGTWAYLMETTFTYQNPGWGSLLRTSDAMGNDVAVNPNKYGYISHYSFNNMDKTNATTVTAIWTLAYKVIDNCNNVIIKIDNVEGDADLKKRIKSQAYALRGYMYLNLASFYSLSYFYDSSAPCVPIYTEPTVSDTQGNPKSTLHQVYQQTISDLESAFASIGDYNRAGKKYKIDKGVIAGLLARAYLHTGEWEKAQQYAEKAHSGYSLMSKNDYLSGFNDNSNVEWIWGHGQIPSQNDASGSFDYIDVSSSTSGYYSFMADPYFKDYFDENDIRYQLFEWSTKRDAGRLMYKKFLFRSDLTGDIVLMRKAEMLLIESEAFAEQGKLPEAIAKLNELRISRGADTPDLSGKAKDELIEEILIERRKELFGEGFSLSDIIRRQKSVIRKEVPLNTKVIVNGEEISVIGHSIFKFQDGSNFVPNSPYYTFAIPVTESTNNPNL